LQAIGVVDVSIAGAQGKGQFKVYGVRFVP
jgi:hypothetical protein